VGGAVTTTSRSARRDQLFLWGLLPALVLLLLAGRVGVMLRADAAGRSAYFSERRIIVSCTMSSAASSSRTA